LAGCIIFPDVAISCYTCIIVCEVTQDLVRAHIICTQSNVHRGLLKIDLLFESINSMQRGVVARERVRARGHTILLVSACVCARKGSEILESSAREGLTKAISFPLPALFGSSYTVMLSPKGEGMSRRHIFFAASYTPNSRSDFKPRITGASAMPAKGQNLTTDFELYLGTILDQTKICTKFQN